MEDTTPMNFSFIFRIFLLFLTQISNLKFSSKTNPKPNPTQTQTQIVTLRK